MKRKYVIFAPEIIVDESEYEEVIKWCHTHLSHPNVIRLSSENVYYLQNDTDILDIINEENDSMLQWGEDTWIHSKEVKINIRNQIHILLKGIENAWAQTFMISLIRILDYSIEANKNVYFIF